MTAVTCELWTDLECASGRKVGTLRVLDGTYGEYVDNTDACSLTVEHDDRVAPELLQVIRITDAIGVVREYRVRGLGERSDDNERTIDGRGILDDLATTGYYRTVVNGVTVYSFGAETRPPTDFFTARVLTNLSEDGLSHWSLGTVASSTPITLTPPTKGWTRLEWCKQIQSETPGHELRARRNGSTGYLIDLIERAGSGATAVRIANGKNLLSLTSAQSDGELATAVTVQGAPDGDGLPATIGGNLWVIGTASGAGPYWVPLSDENGGAGPIAFASQFGTASGSQAGYLLRSDGGTTQITDARTTPDNAVCVASLTGITAGDNVQIVADSSATRMVELKAPGTKRHFRVDPAPSLSGEYNLVRNGTFADWTSDTAAEHWTQQGSLTRVGLYLRTSVGTMQPDFITSGVSATVSVSGGTPGERIYEGETFTESGDTHTVVTGCVLDGSGAGTITIAVADNITLANGTNRLVSPARPDAVPDEPGASAYLMRFWPQNWTGTHPTPTQSDPHLRGPAYTVKYVAGFNLLVVAAGITAVGGIDADPQSPTVGIRDDVGGTVLAQASMTGLSDSGSSTVNETVCCSTGISADTTVCPLLWSSRTCTAYVRWVTMFLAPAGWTYTEPTPHIGSLANLLWQRGNRALLARTLTMRQVRISLALLNAMSGYSLTRETITLGGDVVVESLGITSRVFGLVYSTNDPTACDVILHSQPLSLLQYIAERD